MTGAAGFEAFCTPSALATMTKEMPPAALLMPRTIEVKTRKTVLGMIGWRICAGRRQQQQRRRQQHTEQEPERLALWRFGCMGGGSSAGPPGAAPHALRLPAGPGGATLLPQACCGGPRRRPQEAAPQLPTQRVPCRCR